MGKNLKSKDSKLEHKNLSDKLEEFVLFQLPNSKQKQKENLSSKKNKELQGNAWLDNSPVCTKIIDGDFNLQYMSSAGIQALKIEEVDNYYGKPYPFEFFPDFTKNTIKEKMVEVKKTGETLTVETWVLDMEGTELCFLSTITRINNEDGSFNYLMVVSTEITDRKRAESKLVALNHDLKLSNEALNSTNYKRKIIYSFSDVIQKALTIEDVVWSVSKNVISQLDYVDCVIYLLDETEEYMVQKAAYGNKNPVKREILSPIKLKIGEGIVGGVADSKRGEIIADTSKDDRYVLDDVQRLSEIAVPIMYNDKVIGVIDSEHPEINFFSEDCLEILSTVANITSTKLIQTKYYEELKKSKQDLKENTVKLKKANELSKLGHYEFNFSTNLWISSEIVNYLLGLDEYLDIVKEDYLDFIYHEDIDEVREYYNELLHSKSKKFYKEHRVVNRKTKKIKWVINKGVFVYDKNGVPVKIFGTIQDITERKEDELALFFLNNELKRSNNNLIKINDKLKIINTFSDKIQNAVTINDVVWSVARNAIFQFDNIDCEIYLIDETDQYMIQSAAFINEKLGLVKKVKPIQIKVGEGLVGTVATTKKGEITSNISNELYITDKVKMLSEIAVPIVYNNNVLGVIYAVHSESNFFPETHLDLYHTVASMTATKLIQTTDYEKLKKSKQDLKENAVKLKKANELSKLGHYEFNFSTNLWRSSEIVNYLLGLDEYLDIVKEDYLDFIYHEDIDEVREYYNELLHSKSKKFYKEHRVVNRKTKKIKWVINKGVFVYDKNGVPVKIFGTIQDITERKIIEDRLKDREERFRSLFENSMEITLIVDKTGIIEFISAAVHLVLGYNINELKGQNIFSYIHPDDVIEAYDRFDTRYKDGGIGIYRVFRVKSKLGIYKHLRMITSNQFSEPSINGFVINAHDVSALINAEQEKFKAVYETKESERKRISHDLHDGLGQTIAAASMYMNFLDESLSNQLDDETYQLFEKGKKLVYDATKEARIVSHNFMPVSLKDLGIEYALGKLLRNYEIIKKDLTISLDSNLNGRRLEGEIELNLFRITQELVSNALKHSKCTKIKVTFKVDKTNLLFEVIDNGIGFNTDEIDKIKSSGIGLKGLKERASLLGGKLLIASSELNGTHISVKFENLFFISKKTD